MLDAKKSELFPYLLLVLLGLFIIIFGAEVFAVQCLNYPFCIMNSLAIGGKLLKEKEREVLQQFGA